jgi:hypothetical protein
MKRIALLIPLLFLTLEAQPQSVRVTPDCQLPFAFNLEGQTAVFNNASTGVLCNTWTLSYSSTTFTAVSVIVETAPDNGGTPGSWSTFSATGNPTSSTTSVAIQLGGTASYFPWLRVRLATGMAGTPPPANLITGILQGWRLSATSPGGGGGGGGSGVPACYDSNASDTGSAANPFVCNTSPSFVPAAGSAVLFRFAAHGNASTPRVNVNGAGDALIDFPDQGNVFSAPPANVMLGDAFDAHGIYYQLTFNGTRWILQQNPPINVAFINTNTPTANGLPYSFTTDGVGVGELAVDANCTRSAAGTITCDSVILKGLAYPLVAVTQAGTPGSKTYNYAVLGTDIVGKTRAVFGSTQSGPTTLNGTDHNIVAVAVWSSASPDILPIGACSVYRTIGGATKGIIGTIASCAAGGSLNDTGLAGDGSDPPQDTSGLVLAAGPVRAPQILANGAEAWLSIAGQVYPLEIHAHGAGTVQTLQLGVGFHSDDPDITPVAYFNRSRGSETAQTAVQQGDFLGLTGWLGYDGSTYIAGALMYALVDQPVSDGVVLAGLHFSSMTMNSDGSTDFNGPVFFPDYTDFAQTSAPANPGNGNARVYVDSGSLQLSCLLPSGASCAPTGGGGIAGPNYRQPFTTQTSVTLTHNAGTTAVLTQCFDNSSPPNVLIPQNIAITDANNATVTFGVAQSGYCVVNSSAAPAPCAKYTLSNNGTNWTVAVNGGTPAVGAAISGAATQSVVLFALPSNGIVTGADIKTTTAWSGTGFTLLTTTLGDSVGGATLYDSVPYDLAATVTNTNFFDSSLFKHGSYAGSNVVAALTANQNLNANTITGAVDFRVCWVAP